MCSTVSAMMSCAPSAMMSWAPSATMCSTPPATMSCAPFQAIIRGVPAGWCLALNRQQPKVPEVPSVRFSTPGAAAGHHTYHGTRRAPPLLFDNPTRSEPSSRACGCNEATAKAKPPVRARVGICGAVVRCNRTSPQGARRRGEARRGAPAVVACVHVGASSDQSLDDMDVAAPRREM